MAIRQFVLAAEGEDPSKKRIERLDEQIKQVKETLKLAKESDPKSERVFNLQQRVSTLTTQKDRLKKRTDDRAENEKEESGVYLGNGLRCKCIQSMCPHKPVATKTCKLHSKVGCESTMCPESQNFNALTQI
jgi:hypothetical protein